MWPIYLTIGNIPSAIRAKPTYHAWIPIAFLPIGPKRVHKRPGWSVQKQEREGLEVIHNLLKFILRPISDAVRDGVTLKCGDGMKRRCFLRIAGWLGDHQENCTIHAIYNTRCPICECAIDELGDYPGNHPKRDHQQYSQWVMESDVESLKTHGVKQVANALWTIRDVRPHEIVRPDLLHNMYLGNLEYLMEWIEGFLTVHNRLHAFDDVWANMSTYPGNHVPHKPYRYLTQIKGKEMRAILQIILGVFTASLYRKTDVAKPSGGQEKDFKKAIFCVRYLTDYCILARYRSHTDSTIQYMSTYLQRFHDSKDVFLRYRAGKKAKLRADEISKELTAEYGSRRKSEVAWTVGQRARLAEEDQEERAYRINEALEADSDFNFPKIHMLLHYAEQISRYGSLPQYSTEICETSHKALKDAYRRTNRVDSIPQIIQGYTRNHNFAVHEMKMEFWARSNPNLAQVLSHVLRRTRSEQTFKAMPTTPIYMRLEGGHPKNEIYNLEHISTNFMIPDLEQDVRNFFLENVFQASSNPGTDLSEYLRDVAIQAFNGVEIPVPNQDIGGENAYKYQHIKATGVKTWRGGKARRDAVWVNIQITRIRTMTVKGRAASFSNRLPAFLNALFNVKSVDGSLHKLAHVTFLHVSGNPTPHGPAGMCFVQLPPQCNRVVWLKSLEGAVHLIPLEPSDKWLINNRIDHQTWNELHDSL